jgi:hypothetical protein
LIRTDDGDVTFVFYLDEKKEVYSKYTEGTEADRKQLEKTYGKKQLSLLIETVQSEVWVSSRSKPCPHCAVPIDVSAASLYSASALIV